MVRSLSECASYNTMYYQSARLAKSLRQGGHPVLRYIQHHVLAYISERGGGAARGGMLYFGLL
jgi:hypothetical protein